MQNTEIVNNYNIVTAIDKNYLKIFEVWMQYFEKWNYTSCLKVIVFDDTSEEYINRKGISSIRVHEKIRNARDIYVTRLNAILELLKSGKHVIHTDSDAFWLRDLLPSVIKKDFDLQISIGHGIPKRAIKEWHFSLCCGFFIFQSNVNTLRFFEKWIAKSIEMNHDQNALNELFLDNTTHWKFDNAFYNEGFCSNLNMKIEAINYKIISRETNEREIAIYHPYLSSPFEEIKLLNAITQLRKINDDKFLSSTYYKTLFNFFGWNRVLYNSIKRLILKIKKRIAL